MTARYPRALACGDAAVTIEFGDRIDDELNAHVMALDDALTHAVLDGVIEAVPTYRSLLIHYDPLLVTYDAVTRHVFSLIHQQAGTKRKGRRLRIPVVYGGVFGVDLPAIAERAGLTADDVIARHAAGNYRVHMLGFQPGFAYLGGLDPALASPRRPLPRPNAPPGTISIGGSQCAIHSVESPSGWHWIGRTPVRTYRPETSPVFLIEPGDRITFEPIAASQWHQFSRAAAAGELAIVEEEACLH